MNPSWPKDIAPLDPGYQLTVDDPWYASHKEAREFMQENDYAKEPNQAILKAAQEKRPDVILPGAKRPAGQISGNSPGGSRQGSPSRRDEILEIVDGRIMARDQVLNTTRPLSAQEIRNEIEIRECSDRLCTKERRESVDGQLVKASVVIPGYAPPADMPSANEAVPTDAATLLPRRGGAALQRTVVTAGPLGVTASPVGA